MSTAVGVSLSAQSTQRGGLEKRAHKPAAASPPKPVLSQLEGSNGETVDTGLVSNGSLTDEELEKMMAPELLVAEEERLRHERMKGREEAQDREHQGDSSLPPAEGMLAAAALDEARFGHLDQLLDKASLWTTFLEEQMVDMEKRTEARAAAAAAAQAETATPASAPPAGRRSKRKASPLSSTGSSSSKKTRGAPPHLAASPSPTPTPTQELLPLIEGELREYQLKGVKWLISLYQNGLNGILADQMGLGKTVQTIGFLSHLRCQNINGPFMVVGPLSTLPNWVNEFTRWCPSMSALLYHGSKQERAKLRETKLEAATRPGAQFPIPLSNFPVIVTSYEIVMSDRALLSKYKFKYVIVDEGHRLKNFDCRLLRELRAIPTDNKLLLTGTPLQNNLAELWSLMNFLLPEVFASLSDFQSWFDFGSISQAGGDQAILAAEQRNRTVSKLHSLLKPFMLRRVKADVEIMLPRKQEIILYATMTEVQRALNQQLLDGTIVDKMAQLAEETTGNKGSMTKLSNMLMQMRKNCNHPDLVTGPFSGTLDLPPADDLVAQCGKFALLDTLITRLRADGHKVLVFSQMTRMLDLMDWYLEQRGHRSCRLDGTVKWQDRQDAIDRFNAEPDLGVFLLSTRAGGLGLNLTAADTVIIYDSDWNPQQDLQAMDRCHRIGQQRPVLVLRLATAQSIEGTMLRRAQEKMKLERVVIKKGVFKEVIETSPKLSKAEQALRSATGMSVAELTHLLQSDFKLDYLPQSATVDAATLDKLLDRSHLETGAPCPYPASGPGYEVVQAADSSALLSGVQ